MTEKYKHVELKTQMIVKNIITLYFKDTGLLSHVWEE
jgi:hypothetical protein